VLVELIEAEEIRPALRLVLPLDLWIDVVKARFKRFLSSSHYNSTARKGSGSSGSNYYRVGGPSLASLWRR